MLLPYLLCFAQVTVQLLNPVFQLLYLFIHSSDLLYPAIELSLSLVQVCLRVKELVSESFNLILQLLLVVLA